MSSKHYIVQLEAGVWLARWDGDPGRTMHAINARRFDTREEAETAMDDARKYRPFPKAFVDRATLIQKGGDA